MLKNLNHNGFAIALAWPETFCKQAGAWYDSFMGKIGLSINYHYKVGHAAVVLINEQNGKCHYFDFGRYHAPFGHGRVRDEISDPDLRINSKAIISKSKTIENLNVILDELYHNSSCHGTGPIHASYCNIRFDKAFSLARTMKTLNPWKYGPFTWDGTNCSRFVRSVILSGLPLSTQFLRIGLPLSISPTPIGNVKTLGQKTVYYIQDNQYEVSNKKGTIPYLPAIYPRDTLNAPDRSPNLPLEAQWLAGEGAGSWFHTEKHNDLYKISRYNPEGKIECSGLFYILGNHNLDLRNSYEFTHISHCDKVMIKQKDKIIPLKKINFNTKTN